MYFKKPMVLVLIGVLNSCSAVISDHDENYVFIKEISPKLIFTQKLRLARENKHIQIYQGLTVQQFLFNIRAWELDKRSERDTYRGGRGLLNILKESVLEKHPEVFTVLKNFKVTMPDYQTLRKLLGDINQQYRDEKGDLSINLAGKTLSLEEFCMEIESSLERFDKYQSEEEHGRNFRSQECNLWRDCVPNLINFPDFKIRKTINEGLRALIIRKIFEHQPAVLNQLELVGELLPITEQEKSRLELAGNSYSLTWFLNHTMKETGTDGQGTEQESDVLNNQNELTESWFENKDLIEELFQEKFSLPHSYTISANVYSLLKNSPEKNYITEYYANNLLRFVESKKKEVCSFKEVAKIVVLCTCTINQEVKLLVQSQLMNLLVPNNLLIRGRCLQDEDIERALVLIEAEQNQQEKEDTKKNNGILRSTYSKIPVAKPHVTFASSIEDRTNMNTDTNIKLEKVTDEQQALIEFFKNDPMMTLLAAKMDPQSCPDRLPPGIANSAIQNLFKNGLKKCRFVHDRVLLVAQCIDTVRNEFPSVEPSVLLPLETDLLNVAIGDGLIRKLDKLSRLKELYEAEKNQYKVEKDRPLLFSIKYAKTDEGGIRDLMGDTRLLISLCKQLVQVRSRLNNSKRDTASLGLQPLTLRLNAA